MFMTILSMEIVVFIYWMKGNKMRLKNHFVFQFILLFFLLVVSLTGCALPGVSGGGQRDLIDHMGYHVSVPEKPTRIISVGAATDDIVLSLVGPERVVAISGTANNVPEASSQVPGRVKSTVESVLSFNPDLVIIPDYVGTDTIQALRDAGLPVYVYVVPSTVKESEQLILSLSDLLNESEKGRTIVRDMDTKALAISNATAHVNPQKKVAYMTSMGLTGGKESSFDDMANYVHFKNAASSLGYSQFVNGTREDVVAYNPDVIIVPTNDYGGQGQKDATVADILSDPALAEVTAVKTQQVYQVDAKPLMTYSQYMVDAMADLAYDLYGYKE